MNLSDDIEKFLEPLPLERDLLFSLDLLKVFGEKDINVKEGKEQ